MKKKLTFLAFSLLLAVGWTNVAQAQLKAEPKLNDLTKRLMKPASDVSSPIAEWGLKSDFLNDAQKTGMNSVSGKSKLKAPIRAPKRENNTITADVALTRAEYETFTYDWVDANNTLHRDVKVTEPVTNPYQMAYLLGTTYMNPAIPGIQYSAVWNQPVKYSNIELGWDLPGNARWQDATPTEITYNDITINIASYWLDFDYIYVQSNGTTVPGGSWSFAENGTSLPSGWGGTVQLEEENNGCCTQQGGGTIVIPHSIIDGKDNITVVMSARKYQSSASTANSTVTISGATPESNVYTTTSYAEKTWSINPQSGGGSSSGTYYSDLRIDVPTMDISIRSITVKNANGTVLTSWDAVEAYNNNEMDYITEDGTNYYYYTLPGWSCDYYLFRYTSTGYVSDLVGYTQGSIIIPASLLNGTPSITVEIVAYSETAGDDIYVNGELKDLTTSSATYTWTFNGKNSEAATSVTPPYQNGYTVFLVKVKDEATNEPRYTSTWSDVINYFDTHIEEVVLLTDGTRLNTDTEDAGTMYSYSGELNRFYFIGKGKTYALYPYYRPFDSLYDGAPTYSMFEEFSAHQPYSDAADITDFYSKLLYGNSYNVVHDCQGVNLLEHYFSMSGKTGTDHKSMTNLIFWIPDHRSQSNERTYDEEFLPHVGLYTIWLDAEAERAADYSTSNRMYDVTLDWVSSLNSILDFDVDQDYELWVYVYDDQGNPVADYKVLDRLQMQDLLVHNNTTFTYQVPQTAESQTIVYRVKGWPKASGNTPGKYPNDPDKGYFFALSNLDPVLIPGYENFLSLGVEHYESDFALDVEHNYYRNFLTVDNKNPDNALTASRIENGEGAYKLYRYDVAKPNEETLAADLLFTVDNENNKVEYNITYANQDYIDEANLYNEYNQAYLTGYTDPNALGCPTHGEIANLSAGGGSTEIPPVGDINITFASGNADFRSITVAGNKGTTSWSFAQNGTSLPQGWSTTKAFTEEDDNSNSCYMPQGGTITVPATLLNGSTTVTVTINAKTYNSQYYSCAVTVPGAQTETITITDYTNWNNYTWTVNSSAAATYNDVTFTAGTDVANAQTITKDGVTITNTQTQTSNNSFSFTQYRFYAGTLSFTAPQGSTITKIVLNGSDTSRPVSRISGTGYTYSNNVGTWEGDAASVSLTLSGQVRCSSVVVTVKTQGGGSSGNFELLNNYLDTLTYKTVGQVVFTLPWKSIQVKLQDATAGTSKGHFVIQNNGKLRFVMPAGYNDANVKFVIHNASVYDATNNPNGSNYYHGTFTLNSSTGDTQTITIPEGSSIYGNKDYEAIFSGISSGDVITITGTHTENGILYNYSPDFTYIHVYVQGGTDGIGKNDALNLDAIKFVDQFKAETKEDKHPYRYGYVLKAVGNNNESGRPQIPVLHTNSTVHGFYSLDEINQDVDAYVVDPIDVMNGEVYMTLSHDPEIYYYTLDRKPSNVNNANWEAVSKLQRREDDSYQEMYDNLPQYDDQVCTPPTVSSAPWVIDRFDNHDIKTGDYNAYMSYVPIIWTHGDQKNVRVKWNTENRHNSYGAPIWKTGVAKVRLDKGLAQRQEDPSTKWTFAGEDCSLYMLDDIEAIATMPTFNNVKYVPYMFRIFVKSNNHKLRGFHQVPAGEDPNKPGEHYEGEYLENDSLLCVWSGYVNDSKNADYGVTISDDIVNGAKVYTFHKDKVDRSVTGGEWDKDIENAIFAAPESLIQGEGENRYISGSDLTIVVRFYYLVEGFDASAPAGVLPNRGEGSDPAGYGTEGEGFTPGPATGVKEMVINGIIESVTYVNAQGMQSDKPFDGLNIVITRYSNGVTTTTKLMK